MQKISLEQLKIMVKTIKEEHPNKNRDYYKMFLSTEFLRLVVDNERLNQSMFSIHNKKPPRTKEDRKFFRTETGGFQRQERVSRFAERIYNLQDIKNIDNILSKIKEGNVSGCFAELEAGTHLHRREIPFEFVKETGNKGLDFDIKITSNPTVNCEVKHKMESTELSEKTLERSLKEARSQLPDNEASLIFLKIPEEWTKQDNIYEVFQKTINNFFTSSNSQNVIGIVLRREQRNIHNEGIFYWMYKLLENDKSKIINEEIKNLLTKISSKANENNRIKFTDMID
ncbi:MAG: hypothetical protein WAZ12_03605 [Candidatus Absconditicoccaceae bacterium]